MMDRTEKILGHRITIAGHTITVDSKCSDTSNCYNISINGERAMLDRRVIEMLTICAEHNEGNRLKFEMYFEARIYLRETNHISQWMIFKGKLPAAPIAGNGLIIGRHWHKIENVTLDSNSQKIEIDIDALPITEGMLPIIVEEFEGYGWERIE